MCQRDQRAKLTLFVEIQEHSRSVLQRRTRVTGEKQIGSLPVVDEDS